MRKEIIGYFVLTLSIVGCIDNQALAYTYTGSQITSKFNKLQSIVIPYEYENGVLSDKHATIYKMKNGECAIVAILNNESNFGGYEDVIYFSNKKMKSGYTRSFFSIFLDKEATKKSKNIKYDEFINDSDTQNELRTDLNNYLKKMNKSTLDKC
ncbi:MULTISPECIES: hypothetical protein [Acinetobacter]|uniref:hypothetical protein n=1 Tax=Acinetobacter TaxID=469 RepID=UPI0008068DD7|nr:hypothetical protein [Acinetobacter gyllenbergii]OBY73994.1 hypothetical protein NG55_12505 [Acinetobacter gyllenbergii]